MIILSVVNRSITPFFGAVAAFHIVSEFAFVFGAVVSGEHPKAMSFVGEPHALVDVALSVDHSAVALSFVIVPFATVNLAGLPVLNAATVSFLL